MKILKKTFKILGILIALHLFQDLLFSLHSDIVKIRSSHHYSDPEAWTLKKRTLAYKLLPSWTNYMTEDFDQFNMCSPKYRMTYQYLYKEGSPGREKAINEFETYRKEKCPEYLKNI